MIEIPILSILFKFVVLFFGFLSTFFAAYLIVDTTMRIGGASLPNRILGRRPLFLFPTVSFVLASFVIIFMINSTYGPRYTLDYDRTPSEAREHGDLKELDPRSRSVEQIIKSLRDLDLETNDRTINLK